MEISKPRKITDLRWMNVFQVDWVSKGRKGIWTFVSRKDPPSTEADAVVIVPIHTDKAGTRRLVVIREFRVPLGDYEYGFPAGLLAKESPEEAAVRELKEETGLKVTKITRVSPTIYSSAGLTDEAIKMIFVECEGTVSQDGNEDGENIETLLLDIDQLRTLMEDHSKKFSGKGWPVFLMYQTLGKF
jgi:ADP-ribose pyrophosphatase